jgi:hypothetical protein
MASVVSQLKAPSDGAGAGAEVGSASSVSFSIQQLQWLEQAKDAAWQELVASITKNIHGNE